MGHALEEIHRVLIPDGCVVDIRPYFPASERNRRRARRKVVCLTSEGAIPAGTLRRSLAMFRFTDRLLVRILQRGLFTPIARETFHYRHYLRTLPIFYEYMKTEWHEHALSIADQRRLERLMRRYPDARIRVDTPVQLNVMRKVDIPGMDHKRQ